MSEHVADPSHYFKTWITLVLLPVFSIAAFLTGSRPLAIAVSIVIVSVSTFVAMTRFMEINRVPALIPYIFISALVFVGLFFVLVAPDVMKHEGQRWHKDSVEGTTEAHAAAAVPSHR